MGNLELAVGFAAPLRWAVFEKNALLFSTLKKLPKIKLQAFGCIWLTYYRRLDLAIFDDFGQQERRCNWGFTSVYAGERARWWGARHRFVFFVWRVPGLRINDEAGLLLQVCKEAILWLKWRKVLIYRSLRLAFLFWWCLSRDWRIFIAFGCLCINDFLRMICEHFIDQSIEIIAWCEVGLSLQGFAGWFFEAFIAKVKLIFAFLAYLKHCCAFGVRCPRSWIRVLRLS